MKRTVWLVFAILAATASAQQPAASLKDTLQWMHNFAADNGYQYTGQKTWDAGPCDVGTPNCEQRHDVTTFDSQGCSATVTWSVTLNYKDYGTHTYRFSLKDLDPKSVAYGKDRPFEVGVSADTTNSAKKVNASFAAPADTGSGKYHDESPQTFVELVFNSQDNGKRFAAAFKHAIQLCGGKPSLF